MPKRQEKIAEGITRQAMITEIGDVITEICEREITMGRGKLKKVYLELKDVRHEITKKRGLNDKYQGVLSQGESFTEYIKKQFFPISEMCGYESVLKSDRTPNGREVCYKF